MSRAATGARDRPGAREASIALQNHPCLAEVVDGEITLVDPVVQRAGVPPHHAGRILTVHLQEQAPIGSAGLELRAPWVLVARGTPGVEAAGDERALGLHVSLDLIRMSEHSRRRVVIALA